jgi:hypothetical protein
MKILDILDRASAWKGHLRLEITPEENRALYDGDTQFQNICQALPDDVEPDSAREWHGYIGRAGRLCIFLRVPCSRCGVAFYCACMRALDEVTR